MATTIDRANHAMPLAPPGGEAGIEDLTDQFNLLDIYDEQLSTRFFS